MQQPTNTTDTAGLTQIVPEVTWAQRSSTTEPEKNHIYLTISVPDVDPKQIKLDLQPTSLDFSGYSQTKKATYAVKLEFFAEIDPKESKINHTARDIEMVLRKKELKEEYWPRLLKEKARYHFLRTNFDLWVDEDEQDEAPDDDYMSRMGGMPDMSAMGGMGGMEGLGGMGGDGGFGGIDFSKLGGAGGMDFGGAGDDGDDGDDDGEEGDDKDLPSLEGETGATNAKAGAASTAGGSKIEEVE